MGTIVLLLFVTAILVFTGLYFVFKKFSSKSNPTTNILYWITSMVATPVIFIVVLFSWFSVTSSYQTLEFNKTSWTEKRDSRYVYVDDLIDNQKLIKLNSDELKSLLGEPDYEDDTIATFYIGYSPKHFLNMDPDWLETDLEDGKVRSAVVRE